MAENTVGTLLTLAIQQAGGDGLYHEDGDCACCLAVHLAPGDCLDLKCTVGLRRHCTNCGDWSVYDLAQNGKPADCPLCGAEVPHG